MERRERGKSGLQLFATRPIEAPDIMIDEEHRLAGVNFGLPVEFTSCVSVEKNKIK
jgi:hypothetical protein